MQPLDPSKYGAPRGYAVRFTVDDQISAPLSALAASLQAMATRTLAVERGCRHCGNPDPGTSCRYCGVTQ